MPKPQSAPSLAGRANTIRDLLTRKQQGFILLFCAVGFVLRMAVAFWGPDHFWSYTAYYNLANVVAHGGGYCMTPDGQLCAYFPPVYPTILAACILTGHAKAAIILVSSLIGAGTVALTFLIGRTLFDPLVGLLASCYAALYPYFVWHDAVVQENSTLAFMLTGTVFLLLRSNRSTSPWTWLASGAMLAISALTKANLLLFIPLALIWMAVFAPGNPVLRLRRLAWVALGVALALGPWVVRTWRLAGAPVLYSNGGFSLWTANHRLIFDYFPEQSIDAAARPEWDDLKPEEQREVLDIRDPQGIRQSRWYWAKGAAFIQAHPWLTLTRAVDKIWIAFSPRFSPAKGWGFQTVYFLFYFPILILSGVGAWHSRRQWRELGSIGMLVLAFVLCTAVFWAHTSHRMYLEPFLMILAARALIPSATSTSEAAVGTAALYTGN